MSQYSDDVDMNAGNADHPGKKKLSQESGVESVASGDEQSISSRFYTITKWEVFSSFLHFPDSFKASHRKK